MKSLIKLIIRNQPIWMVLVMLVTIFLLSCENEEVFQDYTELNQTQTTEDNEQPTTNQETNQPPTAIAGSDQAFTLPKNSTLLDGSASSDPDGIIAFNWTKIEGPDSFSIINETSAITIIEDLEEGVYQFELKVTNSKGLIAMDSVKVGVFQPTSPNPTTNNTPSFCDNSNRPQVFAQLTPLGSLSKSRVGYAVASTDTKILFSGGLWTSECSECWGSSRVDIYDTATQEWS
ncbi:MAG TPA: hypothetical protein VKN14_13625, partial [Flavobacteriaceae bacterium]|nr:hypothetical protein [Flavobacteriaceae bacterium]